MNWDKLKCLLLPLIMLLAGCPICPDGELLVIDGSLELKPNQSVQFVFRYGDETYSSPARCDGHWYVDGVEGGSETLGFITPCGKYTAPTTPPAKQPLNIVASKYGANQCADCCPEAMTNVCVYPQ